MVESDEGALEAFWADAKVRAKLNRLSGYLGPSAAEALRPPAWAFGATPGQADELLALVLEGRKTATATALRDFEAADEELPSSGTLSIIVDGAGVPRALIATTEVRMVPFGEVDADHARAEGERDLTLESWREIHRNFFAESGGAPVTEDLPVVLERFEVLYAT